MTLSANMGMAVLAVVVSFLLAGLLGFVMGFAAAWWEDRGARWLAGKIVRKRE